MLLYTSNEQSKKVIKEAIAFAITFTIFQKNKIPRNKCNHGGERLYIENYKTLQKAIKENLEKWKDSQATT